MSKQHPLIVNLYGGPGTGKSTTASGVFSKLKMLGYNCEYATEYAKDLTYDESFKLLDDNLVVIAEQHHRINRLINSVGIIITDSPILTATCYTNEKMYDREFINGVAKALYDKYNNLDIFLKRDIEKHAYKEYGRTQTFEQAIRKDEQIAAMLEMFDIQSKEITIDDAIVNNVIDVILETLKERGHDDIK